MKRFVWNVILCSALFVGLSLAGAEERPVVTAGSTVRVQYQIKSPNSKSWSTATATLKGSVSESMMENTLSQRHPGSMIRILSASSGKNVQMSVRYQISRDGRSWTTGTASLQNALTESMARNQLSVRYPNTQIRILSVSTR